MFSNAMMNAPCSKLEWSTSRNFSLRLNITPPSPKCFFYFHKISLLFLFKEKYSAIFPLDCAEITKKKQKSISSKRYVLQLCYVLQTCVEWWAATLVSTYQSAIYNHMWTKREKPERIVHFVWRPPLNELRSDRAAPQFESLWKNKTFSHLAFIGCL